MNYTAIKHPMISGLAVMAISLTVQGAELKTGPDTPATEKTKGTAQHIGLSEIAVFGRDAREEVPASQNKGRTSL